MTAKERVIKLEAAKKLIEEVRNSLNIDSAVCECCGLTKYHNFDQYQIYGWLDAAINRLDKTSERITNNKQPFES